VDYNEESYEIDDETVKGISRRTDFDGNFVKSLTEHWSTGLLTEVSSSTYSNKDLAVSVRPGIEYNIFPYSESIRRDFRIFYGIGYSFLDYKELTIYDKTKETLLSERLGVRMEFKQPWGQINFSADASHYFHDFSKNHLNLHGSVSLQLLKGFSFSFWGGFSRIHDQLALPKGDASGEEILLEIRELETQYSSWVSIGFEYTFGSIYNNIVNPRF
jgi:hypothetical protein